MIPSQHDNHLSSYDFQLAAIQPGNIPAEMTVVSSSGVSHVWQRRFDILPCLHCRIQDQGDFNDPHELGALSSAAGVCFDWHLED